MKNNVSIERPCSSTCISECGAPSWACFLPKCCNNMNFAIVIIINKQTTTTNTNSNNNKCNYFTPYITQYDLLSFLNDSFRCPVLNARKMLSVQFQVNQEFFQSLPCSKLDDSIINHNQKVIELGKPSCSHALSYIVIHSQI